jgi:hypothetical protein
MIEVGNRDAHEDAGLEIVGDLGRRLREYRTARITEFTLVDPNRECHLRLVTHLLGQPDLNQRLIGHITFIGFNLYLLQQ